MRVHSPTDPGDEPRRPNRRGRPSLVEVPSEPDLHRDLVYDRPVVDGRVVSQGALARWARWVRHATTTSGERAEAELEGKLRELPHATRPNIVAQMSPKGGVGKTTMTFAMGSLFARLGHRALAIDMNPDSGTLGGLVPVRDRADGQLEELLDRVGELTSGAHLGRYISRLPTGLHLLASSPNLDFMASLTPQRYGDFLDFLADFYDVLLLDLGTGLANRVPRFALDVADQVVVVTTPDWQTIEKTHQALRYLDMALEDRPITVALNMVDGAKRNAITANVERAFGRSNAITANIERALGRSIGTTITIPRDDRLRLMLDSGTYNLDALPRPTRMALRKLGLTLGQRIV